MEETKREISRIPDTDRKKTASRAQILVNPSPSPLFRRRFPLLPRTKAAMIEPTITRRRTPAIPTTVKLCWKVCVSWEDGNMVFKMPLRKTERKLPCCKNSKLFSKAVRISRKLLRKTWQTYFHFSLLSRT